MATAEMEGRCLDSGEDPEPTAQAELCFPEFQVIILNAQGPKVSKVDDAAAWSPQQHKPLWNYGRMRLLILGDGDEHEGIMTITGAFPTK